MSNCSGSSSSKGGGGGSSAKSAGGAPMSLQDAIQNSGSQSIMERTDRNINSINTIDKDFATFSKTLEKSSAQNKDEFLKESDKLLSEIKNTLPKYNEIQSYVKNNAEKWAKDSQLKEKELSTIDKKYAKQEKAINAEYNKVQDKLQKMIDDNHMTFTSYDKSQVPYSVYSFRTNPDLVSVIESKYPNIANEFKSNVLKYNSYQQKALDLGEKKYKEQQALDKKYPVPDARQFESKVMGSINVQKLREMAVKTEKINPRLFKKMTESMDATIGSTLRGLL